MFKMKTIKLGVLSLMAVVGIAGQASSQEIQGSTAENKHRNTLEEKVYGLSLLWSEMKYNFVHLDRMTFDVDSLYRATMQRVLETKDDFEFYDELQRFMASFNDGHTQLICGTDEWDLSSDYTPYSTALFGDKIYFTDYRLNTPNIDPELLGAEIIEVEGMPVMEYVNQKRLPKTIGSTLNYKLNVVAYTLLNGPVNTYIDGKARKRNGKVIDFHIIRNGETTRTPDEQYWRSVNKPIASDRYKAVSCRWIDDVALLTINTFIEEKVADQFDSLLMQIKSKKPKGLIIDLRGNGGGITEVAQRLQMHLTDADSIRSFGSQTRINNGYGRAQGNYREEYADYFKYRAYEVIPHYNFARNKEIVPVDFPTVILIGIYSFSACEDFLLNIYETPGRPLLIGEETAGSSGAPLVIYLPHDAFARLSTVRMLYPYSQKPFVGGGIRPDIEVKPTIDDYFNGIDPVIEKALEELHKKK